jgi:hypothetical protein
MRFDIDMEVSFARTARAAHSTEDRRGEATATRDHAHRPLRNQVGTTVCGVVPALYVNALVPGIRREKSTGSGRFS